MSKDDAVEMFVGGLVLDPNTQAPVVILKDETGNLNLPIWIGIAEATSIAGVLKGIHLARPLTHDLMGNILSEVGVSLERVIITDLKDSTYFAEMILSHGDKAMIIDSRPSDAIALALRVEAPIYVSREVLDQAQVAIESSDSGMPSEGESGEEAMAEGEGADVAPEIEDPAADEKDFRNIDKEKWNELLGELDPDDFKYKM